MSDQKMVDEKWTDSPQKKRNRGRSLFGPIVLISAGVFFLLANLNLIPQPNWQYALSFWPLLLIFIGLNILVTQLSAPGGTVLSLLVSVAAVATFGYLLFAGPENVTVRSLGIPTTSAEVQSRPFSVPADGIESAEIELDLSNYPSAISVSDNSQTLLEGVIWTASELSLVTENDGQHATVKLGENSDFNWFLNPASWLNEPGDRTWRIAINRQIPVDLRVDGGNGSATVDLESLTLTRLRLDAGNGSVTATLPSGTYDGRLDGGNGALRVTLPSAGRQEFEVDGANGGMTFLLPEGMPARIEFDKGNGSVAVDERFDLVDGDRERGVYETADFSDSGDGLFINLETGNGSFRISQP